MSDPIGRYLKYTKAQLGYMDKNGIDPNDPLADVLMPRDLMANVDFRLESASGRRAVESETMQKQLDTIKRVLPAATGARKERLIKQQAELEHELNPLNLGNSVTESAKRLGGGIVGAIPSMGIAAADLLTLPLQGVEYGLGKLGVNAGKLATKAREQLQEAQVGLEEMTGAKGIEGIVGNIAGGFGIGGAEAAAYKVGVPRVGKAISVLNAPAGLFAEASNATLRFLGKAKFLEPAMRASMEGNRLQRVGGQVIGDLPVNVLQALTIPDANIHDIAKTIALGTAGSVIGGALSGRQPFKKPGTSTTPFDTDFAKGPEESARRAPDEPESPAEKELAQMVASVNAWQEANPNKPFDGLDEEQKDIIRRSSMLSHDAAGLAMALDGAAKTLAQYVNGEHDNLRAAQTAFHTLSRSGLSTPAILGVMNMQVGNLNGNAVIVNPDMTMPDPPRLLLASGEAPRAVEAAARVESDTPENKVKVKAKRGKDKKAKLRMGIEADTPVAEPVVDDTQETPFEQQAKSYKGMSHEDRVQALMALDKAMTALPREELDAALAREGLTEAAGVLNDTTTELYPGTENRDIIHAQRTLLLTHMNNMLGGMSQKESIAYLNKRWGVETKASVEPTLAASTEPTNALPAGTTEPPAPRKRGRPSKADVAARTPQPDQLTAAHTIIKKNALEPLVGNVAAVVGVEQAPIVATELFTQHVASGMSRADAIKTIRAAIDSGELVAGTAPAGGDVPGMPRPDVSRGSGDVSRAGVESGTPSEPIGPQNGTLTQDAIESPEAMRSRWNALNDELDNMSRKDPRFEELSQEADALWQDINDAGGFTPADETLPSTPPTPPPGTTPEPPRPTPLRTTSELESIATDIPIAEMGIKELNDLIDKIYVRFDKDPTLLKTDLYRAAQRDTAKITQRINEINAMPPESRYALERPVDVSRMEELRNTPLDKLNEAELGELNVALQNANAKLPPGAEGKDAIIDKIIELRDHQVQRETERLAARKTPKQEKEDVYDLLEAEDIEPKKGKKSNVDGFALPETVVSVTTMGAGFLIGYSLPADDEQTRVRNAFLGAAAGFGASAGLFYLKGKAQAGMLQKKPKLPGEASLNNVMRTTSLDANNAEFTPDGMLRNILSAAEKFYANTLHPSLGGEYIAKTLGQGAAVGKHVADMMATFGLWKRESIQWLYSGPRMQNAAGEWVPKQVTREDGSVGQVMSAAAILRSVDGDINTLGKTAIALTALERYTKTGKMPHAGLNPIELTRYIAAVDPKFHAAAKAMRDLHLGLLDVQLQSGLISKEARKKMGSEQFYTALERVFGEVDAQGRNIKKKTKGIGSPTVVESRKGPNEADIRNPVETMIFNIPRVLKAVEIQDKKAAMLTLWEASTVPMEVKSSWMRPKTKSQIDHANDPNLAYMIQELRATMPDLTQEEAAGIINAYNPTPLGPKSDYMSYMRNGKQEVWRIAPDLVNTFQYMQGYDIQGIFKAIGIGSSGVRTGVSLSPDFMLRMGYFDMIQTYMNSQYGGSIRNSIPGLNWIDALYKIHTKHPEYKLYGGGSAEGTLLEGINGPKDVIRRATAAGDTYTADIWSHVKELHPIDAYKTLLTPIAEAGRFSEYLAARRHGESVQGALRASAAVTGYYNQVGPYAAGLFHAVPFMKGATQALDQGIYAAGVHPFRTPEGGRLRAAMKWGIRGIAAISMPTLYFYAANYGDEEIQQLRQTTYGRRFWFLRGPKGEIYSMRKPAGPESVVFGSGLEIMLDKQNELEPEAMKSMVAATINELAIPWLPPAIAAATTIGTGVDVSFGNSLVGARARNNLSSDQSNAGTSDVANALSKTATSLVGEPSNPITARLFSPAGIDYITRTLGGTLGAEALKAADLGKRLGEGQVPVIQEWPIVRKFVSLDMTKAQTRDMEDFYKMASRIEAINNSLNKSARLMDVQSFVDISQRYRNEVNLASSFATTRNDIGDAMRAIEELKHMEGDPAQKRSLIMTYRQQIQRLASTAVMTARMMEQVK